MSTLLNVLSTIDMPTSSRITIIQSKTATRTIHSYLNRKYLKNPVVTGTVLLTGARIITKLIGFFIEYSYHEYLWRKDLASLVLFLLLPYLKKYQAADEWK